MAKKHNGGGGTNSLSVFNAFVEAGRACILDRALDFYHYSYSQPLPIYLTSRLLTMANRVADDVLVDYKTNNSVLDDSPEEYIIAKLLGVDTFWAWVVLAVFGGNIDGCELTDAVKIPVQIAQHLMVVKYRFLQHPLKDFETPIHPKRMTEHLAFKNRKW